MSRKHRQARQRKRAIARIRRELSFWGVDTDDLTDDEIEERVVGFQQIVAKCGVSTQDAANALSAISQCLS